MFISRLLAAILESKMDQFYQLPETEESILSVLSLDPLKAAYGLEIQRRISMASEDYCDMQDGTLYPILKRLRKKEYVIAQWGEDGEAARRKYYTLTEAGAEALALKRKIRHQIETWRRNYA